MGYLRGGIGWLWGGGEVSVGGGRWVSEGGEIGDIGEGGSEYSGGRGRMSVGAVS